MRLGALLGFLLVFLSVSNVSAQVVINEFCSNCTPEWVELYNKSLDSVDLAGWSFLFGSPSQSLVISSTNYPENRVINPNSFFLITIQTNWLNNSGDEIQLFNSSSSDPIDEVVYTGSIGSGNTYSRIPDGSGNFVANTGATENTYNQAPTSTPTPTHTPTPTPKPTNTQKPAPTNKPDNTPTNSPTAITSPTITPDSAADSESDTEMEPTQELILGTGTEPEESPTPDPAPEETKKNHLPTIFSILGLTLILGSAGFLGYKYHLKPGVKISE